MIAKNYIKHPDALRVQRELFFIGHHNSPLLMRLIGVIMDQRPPVPEWFKKAKAAGKTLAKAVKNSIDDFFGKKFKGRKKSAEFQRSKFLRTMNFCVILNDEKRLNAQIKSQALDHHQNVFQSHQK